MQGNTFLSIFLIGLFDLALGQDGRIYGGNQVDIQKAPYMAQIIVFHQKPVPGQPADAEQCAGSILKTNLILTAGHCIQNYTTGEIYGPDRYLIYVGGSTFESGDMHKVKKVNLHPKYRGGGDNHFFYDMALLQLQDAISLDHSKQLVAIAEKDDKTKPGDDVFVSGWGTNPDDPNSNRLYQVSLKIKSAKECHDAFACGDIQDIDAHQICAGGIKKAHCQGDSGGPLIETNSNRQVGIVSYGTTDCTNSKPRIYTRVTDNLDFIESVIKDIAATYDTNSGKTNSDCDV